MRVFEGLQDVCLQPQTLLCVAGSIISVPEADCIPIPNFGASKAEGLAGVVLSTLTLSSHVGSEGSERRERRPERQHRRADVGSELTPRHG